jgi:hypothetical protein
MRQAYDEIPEYAQHADDEHGAESQYQPKREEHDCLVLKISDKAYFPHGLF